MAPHTMKTESRHSGVSKIFTNIWLIFLALIIGLVVVATSVLIAWPIVSYIAAYFIS